MKEIVEDIWLERLQREGECKKHNVLVFSKWDFRRAAKKLLWFNNIAFISIENTEGCVEHYLKEGRNDFDNIHFFPDNSDKVLNLDFDDVDKDKEVDGFQIKAITEEQAKEIVKFVENNLDKHIIVHCKAGKSRSQAVFRFIIDFFPDHYTECQENKYNPCLTPNIEVLAKLKRVIYEKDFAGLGSDTGDGQGIHVEA